MKKSAALAGVCLSFCYLPILGMQQNTPPKPTYDNIYPTLNKNYPNNTFSTMEKIESILKKYRKSVLYSYRWMGCAWSSYASPEEVQKKLKKYVITDIFLKQLEKQKKIELKPEEDKKSKHIIFSVHDFRTYKKEGGKEFTFSIGGENYSVDDHFTFLSAIQAEAKKAQKEMSKIVKVLSKYSQLGKMILEKISKYEGCNDFLHEFLMEKAKTEDRSNVTLVNRKEQRSLNKSTNIRGDEFQVDNYPYLFIEMEPMLKKLKETITRQDNPPLTEYWNTAKLQLNNLCEEAKKKLESAPKDSYFKLITDKLKSCSCSLVEDVNISYLEKENDNKNSTKSNTSSQSTSHKKNTNKKIAKCLKNSSFSSKKNSFTNIARRSQKKNSRPFVKAIEVPSSPKICRETNYSKNGLQEKISYTKGWYRSFFARLKKYAEYTQKKKKRLHHTFGWLKLYASINLNMKKKESSTKPNNKPIEDLTNKLKNATSFPLNEATFMRLKRANSMKNMHAPAIYIAKEKKPNEALSIAFSRIKEYANKNKPARALNLKNALSIHCNKVLYIQPKIVNYIKNICTPKSISQKKKNPIRLIRRPLYSMIEECAKIKPAEDLTSKQKNATSFPLNKATFMSLKMNEREEKIKEYLETKLSKCSSQSQGEMDIKMNAWKAVLSDSETSPRFSMRNFYKAIKIDKGFITE